MKKYEPEGKLFESKDNLFYISSADGLREAMRKDEIIEARVKICDSERNMIVDLPCGKGIIAKNDGAIGIEDGTTKPIALITKVNKPVAFKVKQVDIDEDGKVTATLSRKEAQIECMLEYVNKLSPGDVIPARVTHMDTFGAFVDIGCGIPSLIPIAAISVSRISHPSDRFTVNQDIFVIVQEFKEDGKINLSHKELLGTWDENADQFCNDETVCGVVRSIENYGVFIELTPNLAGLADHNPLIPAEVGQRATVHIKAIIPEKMKIKLNIVSMSDNDCKNEPLHYFISSGNIEHWRYSSDECDKIIESYFPSI
ncbi:MAG: S1 RNA-binding domain-containing protein [Ruminococcus sp.]|jgi:small subunit ribosomal protein S1|nr:S1 RNA-binding domain-containing protein [Ruminococcus sp.]